MVRPAVSSWRCLALPPIPLSDERARRREAEATEGNNFLESARGVYIEVDPCCSSHGFSRSAEMMQSAHGWMDIDCPSTSTM